jgi:hypothetical protein
MSAHIIYGNVSMARAHTDSGWYPVAKQVGEFVNDQAKRTDIVAAVGGEVGAGAPACFYPALAEVQINTGKVRLGHPDKVDMADELWCLEHAAAVGAMTHEAAHARHTFFDPAELVKDFGATKRIVDVITTLEEPRIEAMSIRWHPENRPFLRGCAMEIVAKDFQIGDTRYGAATAAGLLLARVDAGVLSRGEVREHRKAIRAVLGDDTLNALEPLWQRFLMLRDTDYAGQVEVAQEWLVVLGEDPENDEGLAGESMIGVPLPGSPGGSPKPGEGGDEDGEGEGDGTPQGFGDRIKAGTRKAASKMDEAMVEAAHAERRARARAEAKADADRRAEGKAEHEGASGTHGFSPDGFSHYTGVRRPRADERRAANVLGRELERLIYHDRVVIKTGAPMPPGRLRSRVAVEAAAARSAGRHFEGDMWRGKRRKRVESTTLKVGFLGDISGSMGEAQEPLASSQWVVSTAGSNIDAEVASVHFGNKVHAVAPRGYRERGVRLFRAADGWEVFRSAALTIDHELNLLDGRGARVLVIASDGVFVNAEDWLFARAFIPLAQRKGVAVIFLDFTNSMDKGSYGATVVDCAGLMPAQVATLVGRACIQEVQRMDQIE